MTAEYYNRRSEEWLPLSLDVPPEHWKQYWMFDACGRYVGAGKGPNEIVARAKFNRWMITPYMRLEEGRKSLAFSSEEFMGNIFRMPPNTSTGGKSVEW